MKLKPVALGVTAGIVWGGCIFLTTLLSHYTGYAKPFLEALPQALYPGYAISIPGSFIGLLLGFIDGFVSGAIFAWLYNKISRV